MSELIDFKEEHLMELVDQPINSFLADWIKTGFAKDLEKIDSKTFIHGGKVQVCGGVQPYWTGRGQLWTVFSESTKTNFVPTFRCIKRWLDSLLSEKYRRIELSVDCGFYVAMRRAELLGFELETPRAKLYLPDGTDAALYSIVRGGPCHLQQ